MTEIKNCSEKILSVGHSATIFRNFAIRQKTIRQKRHSATLSFGKTIRQKIFGNWESETIYSGNEQLATYIRQKLITKSTIWQNTL